jgi:hypothetical protein
MTGFFYPHCVPNGTGAALYIQREISGHRRHREERSLKVCRGLLSKPTIYKSRQGFDVGRKLHRVKIPSHPGRHPS